MDLYELIVNVQELMEKHGITGTVRREGVGSDKVVISFTGFYQVGPEATERFFQFGFDLREIELNLSRFNLNMFPSNLALSSR